MNAWSDVSVVLIVRNAEAVLPAALGSIPAGAEVIVADGASTDGTVAAARAHGAHIVSQNLDLLASSGGNFDLARNDAAQDSTRDWLFFLDADERIPVALATEIASVICRPVHVAFDMPRVNLFWGQPVRLLGEDRQLRLVRRGRGWFEGRALHRRMRVDGSVGQLSSSLVHENVARWQDVVRRFRHYVPLEANSLDVVPTTMEACRTPIRMFRYYYCRNGAWRDGVRGLRVCIIYALYHGMVAVTARRKR